MDTDMIDDRDLASTFEAAFANTGCTREEYEKFGLGELDGIEQKLHYVLMRDKAQRLDLLARQNALSMGMSVSTARKTLRRCARLAKLDYETTVSYGLHLLDPTDREAFLASSERAKATALETKRHQQEQDNVSRVYHVAQRTGWSYDEANDAMRQARSLHGASLHDYDMFRLEEVDAATLRTYFLNKHVRALNRQYNPSSKMRSFFKVKTLFNAVFDEYLMRPWLTTPRASQKAIASTFASSKLVIYKPNSSSGGKDIRVFNLEAHTPDDIAREIANLPAGVLEEFITQHAMLNELATDMAICTIRITTLLSNDVVHPLYSLMCMGDGTSYINNLHAGGVAIPVDVATGVTYAEGFDLEGRRITHHPATGLPIAGCHIPFWPEALAMVERAARVVPDVGYIGWDVAITPEGPLIIEANTMPGASGLQIPFARDHRGMLFLFEPYLDIHHV